MATQNDTTDHLADLGVHLEHLKAVLDLMTDVEPGDSVEGQKLHRASLLAWQLAGDAVASLEAMEARA